MKKIDITQILKDVRTSKLVRECGMPLGYVAGTPVLKIKNSKPCLIIPFLRFRATGIVDKTLIYPIKYTVTFSLTTGGIVGFEDLSYRGAFKNVDFTKPVGFFRHDAIKNLNKQQYKAKREEMNALYNKVLEAAVNGVAPDGETQAAFRELFSLILEPSLHSTYRWLSPSFCEKYLG